MAVVLGLLLWSWLADSPFLVPIAIAALLIAMTAPAAYQSLAVVWFGLSEVMGKLVSTILLSVLFFLILCPVGLVRRLTGADPMQLKQWKAGGESVFHHREHRFDAEDLKNPF